MPSKRRHREMGTLTKQIIEDGIDVKLAQAEELYGKALKIAAKLGDEALIDALLSERLPIAQSRRAIVALLAGDMDQARRIVGI